MLRFNFFNASLSNNCELVGFLDKYEIEHRLHMQSVHN